MIRINLLPGKKKPLILPPVLIYGSIATVLLIIGLIFFTVYLNGKVSDMQTEMFNKEKKLNELKAQLKEVQNYERDNKEFRRKAKIIEQLKKNQIVPLRLLDEVSEMLPKGVWLTELSDKSGYISIEGYAHTNYDLVTYVQNLKGSKYLTDVMLVESRQAEIEGVSVYKFKLTFKVKV
ncbi:MAG: PilN domain-containing protein [Deferribacteres bacterium]|nr:PilN domain-containing protein [Deferribacteres bacterium]